MSYLHPLDLLSLSRTTKSLRRLLLNRISRYIWTYALSKIEGLPPCPSDMVEPQYVALMFWKHCFVVILPVSLYSCWMLVLKAFNRTV